MSPSAVFETIMGAATGSDSTERRQERQFSSTDMGDFAGFLTWDIAIPVMSVLGLTALVSMVWLSVLVYRGKRTWRTLLPAVVSVFVLIGAFYYLRVCYSIYTWGRTAPPIPAPAPPAVMPKATNGTG